MVSGSEQKFLLGLGVSAKNSLGVLLINFNAAILPCSFIPSFSALKGLKESHQQYLRLLVIYVSFS